MKPPGEDEERAKTINSRKSLLSRNSVEGNFLANKIQCKGFFRFLGISFGLISTVAKIYLIVNFAISVYNLNMTEFLKPYYGENIDFVAKVVIFIAKASNYLGIVMFLLEAFYSLYVKYKMFEMKFSMIQKINYYRFLFVTFCLCHGFCNEALFKLYGRDIDDTGNYFVLLYRFKLKVLGVLIWIIIVFIVLAILAIVCGKGEYIGTWKNTTLWSNGMTTTSYEDVYEPDYESASGFCSCGFSCGIVALLVGMIFFPLITGLFCYAYAVSYSSYIIYGLCYLAEFLFNHLHFACFSSYMLN